MNRTDRARHLRRSTLTVRAGGVIRDYLVITAGAMIYALSVNFFTAPNNIAPGGVTGLATMLNHLICVPIGATALILNIPLFIWGAIEAGARFITRTVIASATVSILIDLVAIISFRYEGDRILAALFGGILSGFGIGLILLRGGSTGGTDIIGRNLHARFPYLSVGTIILLSDAIIIILSAIVYGRIENALYAVITIFISTKVIDAVVFGFSRDNGKLLIIITADPKTVARDLIHKAHRGVTVLKATGGYSGESRGVILCAAHSRDAYRVRSVISEADPTAFIITSTANAISGLGFGTQ